MALGPIYCCTDHKVIFSQEHSLVARDGRSNGVTINHYAQTQSEIDAHTATVDQLAALLEPIDLLINLVSLLVTYIYIYI